MRPRWYGSQALGYVESRSRREVFGRAWLVGFQLLEPQKRLPTFPLPAGGFNHAI